MLFDYLADKHGVSGLLRNSFKKKKNFRCHVVIKVIKEQCWIVRFMAWKGCNFPINVLDIRPGMFLKL